MPTPVTSDDLILSRVSLAEAKRTANVYSKMEYGLKRLLWLGN